MNSGNYSPASVFSAAALIVCIIIRALSCIFAWGAAANYVFYTAVIITIIIVLRRSFLQSEYNNATDFKAELKPYALCAVFGFMLEFIGTVIHACSFADEKYLNGAELVFVILTGVFALLSSLYFIAIALSCGKTAYDFKRLKVLHLAPFFWAMARVAAMVPEALSFKGGVFSVLKAAACIFAVFFFYYFVAEIGSSSGAKKQTVFFSKAFSYFTLLVFFSRCFELISKSAQLKDTESLFALSVFLIGLFAHFYRRQITSPNPV